MKRVLHQAILLSLAVLASSAVSAQEAMSVGDSAYAIAVNGNLQVGPVNLPIVQEPMNELLSSANGGDNHVSVASLNVPLGLLNLATLSGVDLHAQASPPGLTDSGHASAAIGNASLLGGLISANNISTTVSSSGNDSSGTPIVINTASTTIGNLSVGGVAIPVGTISPNTTIGVTGVLPINIAGLLHANIPVSGQLTLNEQSALGPYGLDVNAMHLRVAGNLLGLAALNLDVIVGGPEADNETPARVAFNCPAGTFPGPKDGFFAIPHSPPTTSASFFQCIAPGANKPDERSCPPSLLWNDNRKECDWPEGATES